VSSFGNVVEEGVVVVVVVVEMIFVVVVVGDSVVVVVCAVVKANNRSNISIRVSIRLISHLVVDIVVVDIGAATPRSNLAALAGVQTEERTQIDDLIVCCLCLLSLLSISLAV
jgi:hypothetical protein